MKRTIKILAATLTALIAAGCAGSDERPPTTADTALTPPRTTQPSQTTQLSKTTGSTQKSASGGAPAGSDSTGAKQAATPSKPGSADSEPDTKNKRVMKAAAEYWGKHPGDYAGLARAVGDAGGDTIRFTFEKEGQQNLTGEQAQAAMRDEGESGPKNAVKSDVPLNAFKVGAHWYHVQDQDGEWWNFNGTWNFRDDYIGAGSPDNAAGVAVEGMDKKCWRQDGDHMWASSYDNEDHSNLTYRKDVDSNSAVWGIRDRTSGFKQLTDHGMLTISFKRIKSGCKDEKPSGRFYLEHNQDGGGGWSASINLAIFSISYSGDGGMTLQKSSKLTHRP